MSVCMVLYMRSPVRVWVDVYVCESVFANYILHLRFGLVWFDCSHNKCNAPEYKQRIKTVTVARENDE